MTGTNAGDRTGFSVSGAGDINGESENDTIDGGVSDAELNGGPGDDVEPRRFRQRHGDWWER